MSKIRRRKSRISPFEILSQRAEMDLSIRCAIGKQRNRLNDEFRPASDYNQFRWISFR